jgi:alpha-ribazole phosphatase
MTLLLVRHTTPQIEPQRCYGRLDVPLAASAEADIAAAVAALPRVERVICSPARRCLPLGAALARRDQADLVPEPALAELDFGTWEGVAWDDVDRTAVDAWAADPWGYAPGDGESLATLWARIAGLVARLPPPPATVALVSHHGPLRVLLLQLLQRPWQELFDYKLDFGGSWLVERTIHGGVRVPAFSRPH